MSQTKFTPGPWKAYDNYVEIPGKPLIEVDTGNPIPGDSSNDTHLIAAAPDLYEALEVILEEPHGCPFCDSGVLRKPNDPDKSHTENCGYHLAAQALTKARGGDPR